LGREPSKDSSLLELIDKVPLHVDREVDKLAFKEVFTFGEHT